MGARIDFIGRDSARGELAEHMVQGDRLDAGAMRPFIHKDGRAYISIYKGYPHDPAEPQSYVVRPIQTNATLRRDEWKQLDEALLVISRERLGGVDDLVSNNLTYNLGNAMGTPVLEYHNVSDNFEAELTMDGITRTQGDRPDFQTVYLPIPIIHVDYEINMRTLETSRRLGNPLDTTSAEMAARRCMEKLEDMLFTSTSYTYAAGTIRSYLNELNRNQVTLALNWNASAKTGAQIVADVLAMKQASIDAKHYGPWKLYIPTAYETVLDEDYDATTPGTTTRERIMKIDGITGIKVIDRLTANNVLLVQMTTDVVRLVRGMGLTNIQWKEEGNFVTKYKVIMIQVPQVRSDQAGNSGLTHLAA